jgi:hypothetical protein
MAARWVGVSRPHNENTAARHGVARTFQDAWHALGVLGILFMAAAMNFALYPDALAAVVSGERQVVGFVPEDPSQPSAPAVVVDETEVRLLAATVWGEARSEGEDGMRAVAHVMVNRIGQRFGEDLATVILSPKQFSVWNRGDPNRRLVQAFVANPARYTAADDPHWVTAQRVARHSSALGGSRRRPPGNRRARLLHRRAGRRRAQYPARDRRRAVFRSRAAHRQSDDARTRAWRDPKRRRRRDANAERRADHASDPRRLAVRRE